MTKEYAIMKLQRGKLFCNNSGKAAPRWEHSRGGAQGGSPEPDVFAIGKKDESFDFRKTDDRTREP